MGVVCLDCLNVYERVIFFVNDERKGIGNYWIVILRVVYFLKSKVFICSFDFFINGFYGLKFS